MSNLTFRKDECAILYGNPRHGRHSIEIVRIANHDVRYDDEKATISMGAFATEVSKKNLFKLPSGIKRLIKEQL